MKACPKTESDTAPHAYEDEIVARLTVHNVEWAVSQLKEGKTVVVLSAGRTTHYLYRYYNRTMITKSSKAPYAWVDCSFSLGVWQHCWSPDTRFAVKDVA